MHNIIFKYYLKLNSYIEILKILYPLKKLYILNNLFKIQVKPSINLVKTCLCLGIYFVGKGFPEYKLTSVV